MIVDFEDGSYLELKKTEDNVQFILQAKHLGKEFKITSMSVNLSKEEAKKIYDWLKEIVNE